jgi:hypothetical protein
LQSSLLFFKSARGRPATQKEKGFHENKDIIRTLADGGVVNPGLRADAR